MNTGKNPTRADAARPSGQAAISGFPPAPWNVWGTMQAGLFPLVPPFPVQSGLTTLLPRHLLVGTIRYLGGDLRYNLLWIGSPARAKRHAGVFLHCVWVDSPPARQAAQQLWGLNASTASFSWTGQRADITADGFTVAFTLHPRTRTRTPLLMPFPCFGTDENYLLYSLTPVHAKARPATMRLHDWPDQLPSLQKNITALAVDIPCFRMTVPGAHPIGALPGARPLPGTAIYAAQLAELRLPDYRFPSLKLPQASISNSVRRCACISTRSGCSAWSTVGLRAAPRLAPDEYNHPVTSQIARHMGNAVTWLNDLHGIRVGRAAGSAMEHAAGICVPRTGISAYSTWATSETDATPAAKADHLLTAVPAFSARGDSCLASSKMRVLCPALAFGVAISASPCHAFVGHGEGVRGVVELAIRCDEPCGERVCAPGYT